MALQLFIIKKKKLLLIIDFKTINYSPQTIKYQ
jgi:hypothetical protein